MVGVNEDNFVVLVNTILVNPVRVQDTQVTASLADTLLRYTSQTSLGLEVVDTLADGLAVGSTYKIQLQKLFPLTSPSKRTLGDLLLAVTPPDTDTVDNVALLGLVAETTSLVGARGTRSTVDYVQLTVFPAPADLPFKHIDKLFHSRNVPNAEQESEDIRLLLFVELANVFVCAHVAGWKRRKSKLTESTDRMSSR